MKRGWIGLASAALLFGVACGGEDPEVFQVLGEDGAVRSASRETVIAEIRSGRIQDATLVFVDNEWKQFSASPSTNALLQEARGTTPQNASEGRNPPRSRPSSLPKFRYHDGSEVPAWRFYLMLGMMGIGFLMALAGGLWMLIVAFQTSVGWGCTYLLFAPIFIFFHFDKAWRPLALNVMGLVLMFFSFFVLA